MKVRNIILFASAAAVMSSCGIYNKYERPDVNTQGLVRDTASISDTLAVSDTASFGNLPWRSVFTDPQLQTLIEYALEHNTNMLNAALNVKMVQAQLTAAKLAFVPSFTFTPQEHIVFMGRTYSKQNLLTACTGKLEHRPLRQPPQRKAQRRCSCLPQRTTSSW